MTSFDPAARPSRTEFLARRKKLQRFTELGQIAATVVGLAGSFLVLILLTRSGSRPSGDWIGISFFASFLPFFFVAMVAFRSYGRRFGASCPACNAPLAGVLGQIAVASGRCGKCGEIVCE